MSKTGTTLSEAMDWKANPRMPSATMLAMKGASVWLIPNTWLATVIPPTCVQEKTMEDQYLFVSNTVEM